MPTTEEITPLLDEQRVKTVMADWSRQCGRRLQARRKSMHCSQERLAALVGVTTPSISKFELGQVVPRDAVRLAIACSLLCEVADIWTPMDRAFVTTMARAA